LPWFFATRNGRALNLDCLLLGERLTRTACSPRPSAPERSTALNLQLILADPQAIFRAGVARVLSADPGFHIALQCSSADQLRQALPQFPGSVVIFAGALTPDPLPLAADIRQAGSRSIFVLEHGAHLSDESLDLLDGLVLRSVAGPELVECIRRVAAGERSIQHTAVKSAAAPDQVGTRVLERLTPKELQIIALVTEGAKNKEIAAQLGTKEQVVKNYLRSIYDKTGVSDRLELALFTVHHRALAEATERLRAARPKNLGSTL